MIDLCRIATSILNTVEVPASLGGNPSTRMHDASSSMTSSSLPKALAFLSETTQVITNKPTHCGDIGIRAAGTWDL